jgi:acyl-CoA synthetase
VSSVSTPPHRPTTFSQRVSPELRAEYRARGWWSDQTLADHVGRHARERPNETAFTTVDGRLSWAQYDSTSDGLGQLLIDIGLEPRDRVAIRLPDTPSYHVAQLACEKAGIVVVGVPARAGQREIEHLLVKTGAVAVISHDSHRGEQTANVVRALPGIRHHIVVPAFEMQPDGGILVDGELREPAPDRELIASRRLGPDDLWLINSTSGTTGLPKCVLHNQNRWHYFSRMAIDFGGLRPSDVVVSVVPTPYGFGQWSAHFVPCYLGANTALIERFDTGQTLSLIERERATVLCAVSTQLRMLLADPACERSDLSSLRVMFTGGENVPYEAARQFEQTTGAAILNVYGSNEAGFVTGTSVRDPQERRLRTAGRLPPGTELRLYDDNGEETSRRGQPGSRGPSIGAGYLDDPAADAELFNEEGFVLQADIVELDEEGYLTVVGRKSDLIIRGGKNISATEVEAEVSAHPAVALASAVPIPDSVFGERVCVFVELRQSDATLELKDLTDFILARGASKELLPERLVVLDELPQSAGGKVAKNALREFAVGLANRSDAEPAPDLTQQDQAR